MSNQKLQVKFLDVNSGFTSRKQESEYDNSVLAMIQLMAKKLMELIKVVDHAKIDLDTSPIS